MAAHLKTSAQGKNPCQNPTIKTPLFFEHKNTGKTVGRNQLSHINEMDLEQHLNRAKSPNQVEGIPSTLALSTLLAICIFSAKLPRLAAALSKLRGPRKNCSAVENTEMTDLTPLHHGTPWTETKCSTLSCFHKLHLILACQGTEIVAVLYIL